MFDKLISGMEKIIKPINVFAHRIAMLVLFCMMVLTTADVVGRKLFSPITGAFELTSFALALVIFYGLGYTQMRKDHITISFLVDRFSRRVQAAFDVVIHLVFLALVGVTAWQVIEHAKRLYRGNEHTVDLGLPVYIFAVLASIGLIVFALSILLDLVKSARELVRKHES